PMTITSKSVAGCGLRCMASPSWLLLAWCGPGAGALAQPSHRCPGSTEPGCQTGEVPCKKPPSISDKLKSVLILLPPSEGKTAHTEGSPFDFADLSFPELEQERRQVLDALAEVSAREDAMSVLGVG